MHKGIILYQLLKTIITQTANNLLLLTPPNMLRVQRVYVR